jgi:PST family polysaccharide transporter
MTEHTVADLSGVQSPPQAQALDGSLPQEIVWTSGATWASQILTWVSTLFVARLLTSEDYGLVGMVTEQVGTVGAVP